MLIFFTLGLVFSITPEETTRAVHILSKFCINCNVSYIGKDSGYGVKATQKISYGDLVMKIPFGLVLTSFDYYPWSTYFEDADSSFKLIPRLMYEKYVKPEKNILVEFLPSTFNGIFSMSESEMKYFFDSFGYSINFELPVNCTQAKLYFNAKIMKIPNIKSCKECFLDETFMWACQNVLTRAYSFTKSSWNTMNYQKQGPNDGNIQGTAIIPGVDLFNHMPRPPTNANTIKTHGISYTKNPSTVLVKADRATNINEEIFMTYGPKKNLELLILHGFIIENNLDDYFLIGFMSDIKNCKNYDNEQKLCIFPITKYEISIDVINYLVGKRKSGREIRVIDEVYSGERREMWEVLKEYWKAVERFGIDRCKKGFRETLRKIKSGKYLDREKTIDNACKSSHLVFFTHLERLEKVMAKLLYTQMFS